jgi:hypothetical protein
MNTESSTPHEDAVEAKGANDHVLRGTDISVHALLAIEQNEGVSGVLEAYPSLATKQVELVVEFAKSHPADRIFPNRSLKRTMSDLAESGIFDVDSNGKIS